MSGESPIRIPAATLRAIERRHIIGQSRAMLMQRHWVFTAADVGAVLRRYAEHHDVGFPTHYYAEGVT